MRRPSRTMTRVLGAGIAALVCAGQAPAAAPALCNASMGGPAPAFCNAALGGGATRFRGTSVARTFPGRPTVCGPTPHGGRFVYRSRGFASGGIEYGSRVNVPQGWCSTSWCGSGIYPWYYYPYYYAGWQSTYAGGPLYEIDRRVGAGSQTVIVILEAKVDEALDALQAGRFASARLIYLERAEDRRRAEAEGEETGVDRTALRLAALAAAGERRYAEADRLFGEAYAQEPSLVERPMAGATLVGGRRAMRAIVNGAVAYAYKEGTPDAWKMVAWLMQGEGRNERARAMMDRADEIAGRVNATESEDPEKFAAVER